jgi:hypothetical protein
MKMYSGYLSRANIGRKCNHRVGGKMFIFKVLRCIHFKRGLCNLSNSTAYKQHFILIITVTFTCSKLCGIKLRKPLQVIAYNELLVTNKCTTFQIKCRQNNLRYPISVEHLSLYIPIYMHIYIHTYIHTHTHTHTHKYRNSCTKSSCTEAPLGKAVLALLVKKFPLFHIPRKFSTIFPTSRNWLLCTGSSIKYTL